MTDPELAQDALSASGHLYEAAAALAASILREAGKLEDRLTQQGAFLELVNAARPIAERRLAEARELVGRYERMPEQQRPTRRDVDLARFTAFCWRQIEIELRRSAEMVEQSRRDAAWERMS